MALLNMDLRLRSQETAKSVYWTELNYCTYLLPSKAPRARFIAGPGEAWSTQRSAVCPFLMKCHSNIILKRFLITLRFSYRTAFRYTIPAQKSPLFRSYVLCFLLVKPRKFVGTLQATLHRCASHWCGSGLEFSQWPESGFDLSLLCGSGSCSSSEWFESAITGLQILHGFIQSLAPRLHCERLLPSMAPFW
jgi:hypothetical protein